MQQWTCHSKQSFWQRTVSCHIIFTNTGISQRAKKMAESSDPTTSEEMPTDSDDAQVDIDEYLADKFRGCLAGDLMGDCLGNLFEFKWELVDYLVLNKYFNKLNRPDSREPLQEYTDDTAMTRSIARSLLAKRGFDAKDMAKRFVKEFFSDPRRGYGNHVVDVFDELKETKVKDPFGPAKLQFGGAGSYGNGGAMRIAPIALFALNNEDKMIELAKTSTLITHTHRLGYNGAILQCLAVHQALKSDPNKPLNASEFLSNLKKKMENVESEQSCKSHPYAKKLDTVKELLEISSSERCAERHVDKLAVEYLGNDVTALGSVPIAIFAVLSAQESLPNIKTDNKFQRCVQYAISLGGDTDTIGSMAGAIAGAHLGFEATPKTLHRHCEELGTSVKLADELFDAVMGKKRSPGRSCMVM